MRVRCKTCGGEYDTTTPDGMAYFHHCPPIAAVKVQQKDGSLVLVPRVIEYVDEVDPDTGKTVKVPTYVLPAGVDGTVVEEVALERKDARNENPDPKRRDAQGKTLPIADGLGVDPIATPTLTKIGLDDALGTGAADPNT